MFSVTIRLKFQCLKSKVWFPLILGSRIGFYKFGPGATSKNIWFQPCTPLEDLIKQTPSPSLMVLAKIFKKGLVVSGVTSNNPIVWCSCVELGLGNKVEH